MKEKNYSQSYPKIVALGFALLILLGTGLLMLPVSSKVGSISFIDALFTATSATCITGLVPFDTFTTWSVFGQVVIISLIQIGGLGFITFLAIFMKMAKKKMSLKQKMLLKESIGSLTIGEVKTLVKSVLCFTACCEIAGAILLSIRFIPLTDFKTGIAFGVFTSISAFCNAGFDLMGMFSPSSSLTTVNDDPVIILTVSALVVFGGLGFIVWEDMKNKKFNPKSFSVHTKLVLISTAILLVAGTILFLLFEYNNTLKEMNFATKLLNAFFCSVTPRTAGFNSVDVAAMTPQSKLITMLLMFIGGSSGSTAGGVKTTSVAILFICVLANIRSKSEAEIFKRRITSDTIKKAVSIVVINASLIFTAGIIISLVQGEFKLTDIMFECFSAMGTVGITTGITPELSVISQIVIITLMYIGRLTTLIFALSFVEAKQKVTSQKPKCSIMVG